MAYPIESPVLNWAILLGAILGAIGLVWWLNKHLKGFLSNVSSHGVDHTWNRPWWRGGRRESTSDRERYRDEESADEKYYRNPATGELKRRAVAEQAGEAGKGEDEEAEEEEPSIEYTTDHKNTLQAWSESHAKEIVLLKELHKDFLEARKKFQEIIEKQKEKIDALKQFETPAVWNNIQADTIKTDIKKLRETTERIKALVDEIEAIIKNRIGKYLEMLFMLFERDLTILKQEYALGDGTARIPSHPEMHPERPQHSGQMLDKFYQKWKENRDKALAIKEACGELVTKHLESYKRYYAENIHAKVFIEENNTIKLHAAFDPSTEDGKKMFFAVVNEESNGLKALVAQFNRIEHAMHQFFMRGTITADNKGLHNLHENQEAFDALLKRVVNETHLIIKPVTTQEEFNQMYAIYKEAFPDEDEREGYHELWKYAKGEEMEGGKYYTELWVVKAMNVVIGGVIFDIVACDAGKFTYGSAWYSFLAKEAQKKGISHHYFEVREDVVKRRGGMMSYPLFGLFCEMDIPKGHDTAISSMNPSDRLKIWRSMGWLYVDTYYEQPPLAADKKAVPLLLHCIPFEPGDWAKKEGIPVSQFKAWLDTWIEYGFADEEDEELTALQEQSKQRMLHKMKVVNSIVPFAPAGNAVKERFHLLLENIMYPDHEELQLKESGA